MLPLLAWVRIFLLAVDAAAGRAALSLGSMSTQNSNAIQATGDIDANSHKITNLTAGSTTGNAVEYDQMNTAINSAVTALDWKNSARAATTAALPACTYANGSSGVGATLTGNANGALEAQDGITLSVNQFLLVKNQATGAQNGKYKLTTVGDGSNPFVLTRSTDFDSASEVTPQAAVSLDEGSTQAGYIYKVSTTGSITIGTTAISFAQVGTLSLGSATPQALGSASAGSSSAAAKDDHVHPTDGLVVAAGTGLTAPLQTVGQKFSNQAISTDVAMVVTKDINIIDCGGGNRAVTFPDAATYPGHILRAKRVDSSNPGTNTCTLGRAGSDTVEDTSGTVGNSLTMVNRESHAWEAVGTVWIMIY